MKYRTLGKTGMRVSVVGVGTWQFGGEWGFTPSQDEVNAIFDCARDCGINLIDTAECYGDHTSERLVGEAVKKDRENWIIATKFGHKFHNNFDRTELWSADEVEKQLEASLKALQTDYIDLYQFHSGNDEVFDNDDLWSMLQKQVEAGKVRHLGISIGKSDNLHQTARSTEVGSSAIQVVYNRLNRNCEERVFPSCLQQNLGVLARVPLASGLLSGKYKAGTRFTNPNDARSRKDQEKVDQALAEVEELKRTEVPQGVPMAEWALAWCLQHPAVSCVIPGCKDVAQVQSNARAADLDLVSDDHLQAIA